MKRIWNVFFMYQKPGPYVPEQESREDSLICIIYDFFSLAQLLSYTIYPKRYIIYRNNLLKEFYSKTLIH